MGIRGVLVPLGLFLVVVLAGPTSAGGASSAAVVCGQLVVEDTRLERDLVGCPGDGLIIGAPGVTLDLNGHSITGGGVGAGVLLDGRSADDALVKNGRIAGFGVGISGGFSGLAPSFRVESMRVANNGTGVSAVELDGPGAGAQATIVDSEIEMNAGTGVYVARYSQLTVLDSRITRNGANGIEAHESLPGRYERNQILNNVGTGLLLFDATGSMVDNRFNRNGGIGLRLEAVHPSPLSASFVQRNEANNNGGLGIWVSSFSPWEGFDGGGNVANRNGDQRDCLVETVASAIPLIPADALNCRRAGRGS